MLKYPCLVLDHDDTVVQSEATVNYPFFCYILDQFRPGARITLQEYTQGCFHLGFADMCRQWYGFTEQEIEDEYHGWQEYITHHIPAPFPGIERIIRRQKAEGGSICVVSHSCIQNITRDYSAHFGILPDDIYGWDLPEALRKPSTYPLEQIMAKYGLSPQQLLVVDDMKPAWEMASKAGVPIAFAAWGRKDYPEIMAEMTWLCAYSFDSPGALERFLFDEV
ncbi:MAG: HAD hydrolase-like protein [Eubacteriales bacterium]|nr:HAD hydrolase-like protein [Eubacteriales bacterium]